MRKPVLLTVDDDAEVLRAVERDLRRRYADRYRVMRAGSGQAALSALQGLKVRNDAVALMLVDQRMPQMTGVSMLGQAMELYPEAKRVLLTAYADGLRPRSEPVASSMTSSRAPDASLSLLVRSKNTRTWIKRPCKKLTCIRGWRARL